MNKIYKEGDLYKVITLLGKTFEVRYGYYSEKERLSKFGEVLPIYPDFLKLPVYTDEGQPFVTQMQDICDFYVGEPNGEDCYSCKHYHHGDDLLGICICDFNRKQGGKNK